jgi:uncharacterized repeat protein (TIGR01451 family)
MHDKTRFSLWGAAVWLGQYWIALAVALLIGALVAGAPAWAAPVRRPPNQTVPRPTPTSPGEPVATATPRPGGDEEDDSSDTGGDTGGDSGGQGEDSAAPDNSDIFGEPEQPATGSAPGAAPGAVPVPALTAGVDVALLNVRQGPGTGFGLVGTLPAGSQVTVLARSEDGAWWYVCCLPGTTTGGWASAQLLTPSFDRGQAAALLPLFAEMAADPAAAGSATPVPAAATPAAVQAGQPLALDFRLDPPFVWQGITATLTITVANPSQVEVRRAELSDELPAALTLLDATADAGGNVQQRTTAAGRPLLIFRWPVIPAGASVSATIRVQVDSDLADGAVVDNLVAARGANTAYSTGAITIGMPPFAPPAFD